MSEDWKERLVNQLEQLATGERVRLILTVDFQQTEELDAPTQKVFSSRREYRQALVAQQERLAGSQLSAVLRDLRQMGLSASPAPLAGQIIVEGDPNKVVRALQLDAVVAACADERLSLIEPEANGRTATDSELN